MPLTHSPCDGSAAPFTIGLPPLDLAGWIEADERLEDYLAEKDRLFEAHYDMVFRRPARGSCPPASGCFGNWPRSRGA